jgi:hypothetical protein
MGNVSEHAYDLTNVAKNVTNFHYVRTLLVHGTADGRFFSIRVWYQKKAGNQRRLLVPNNQFFILRKNLDFKTILHLKCLDNVHFQNTAELITAFVRENVQFNLMVCFKVSDDS